MSAHIIDGRALAKDLRERIRVRIVDQGLHPGLAVILVGSDPASEIYVGRKMQACERVGIASFERRLPADISQDDLLTEIDILNKDDAVHGILLQLPLPQHLDKNEALQAIAPHKDVDGLHPQNIGKLTAGLTDGFVPCTPMGAHRLIKSVRDDLRGLNALMVGCSLLFGRPMGQLMLQEDCTVTFAHRYTSDLEDLCAQADIICVAVGKPNLIKGEWLKPGCIVIDVGINRLDDGRIIGDVEYESAACVAGAITPVPGGVGPMTIACLLENTLAAAEKAAKS